MAVNVCDYGAKGDGATNDTAAIQSAVDACPAEAAVVFPPELHFCIDGNVGVNVPTDRVLMLEGTTVEMLPAAPLIPVMRLFSTVPGARNVRSVGGEFIGDLSPIPYGKHRIAWRGDEVDEFTVEGGARFRDWTSDAIWIGGNRPSTRVRLENLDIEGFSRNAISVVFANGIEIARCAFRRAEEIGGQPANPGAGVDVEPNVNEQVNDLTLYDCTAEDVEVGYFLQPGKGLPGSNYRVYGCSSLGARRNGIILNSVTGGTVDNCHVRVPAPVEGQNLPVGISIGGATEAARAAYVIAAGNVIEGGGRALVIAGARDFRVFNNRITDAGRIEIVGLGAAGDFSFGATFGDYKFAATELVAEATE
jgi:Pectate lyase superfamily protein